MVAMTLDAFGSIDILVNNAGLRLDGPFIDMTEEDWDRVNAVNIFISTTEPGRIEVVKHDGKRLIEAWKAFRNLAAVWRFSKRFDPRPTLEVGE